MKTDNILIHYKGGGYDGCFWEWNFAVINDNKFYDIFSSGRFGITDHNAMLEYLIENENINQYYLYDLNSTKELQSFSRESNEGHVLGVARFLENKFDIYLYAICDMCENEVNVIDCIPAGFEGCGGIAIQATKLVCDECQSCYRCDYCGEVDKTTQSRKEYEYHNVCQWCNED